MTPGLRIIRQLYICIKRIQRKHMDYLFLHDLFHSLNDLRLVSKPFDLSHRNGLLNGKSMLTKSIWWLRQWPLMTCRSPSSRVHRGMHCFIMSYIFYVDHWISFSLIFWYLWMLKESLEFYLFREAGEVDCHF